MKAIIVEQDPWIAELLRSVLRDLGGIETRLFDNGVSALNHLRSDRVDLLIADQQLSDRSGLDLARDVARRAPRSVRVLITASINRQLVLDARAAGVADLIVKPFKLDDLRKRLARLLQRDQEGSAAAGNIGDLDGFLQARLKQPIRLAWTTPERQHDAATLPQQTSRSDYLTLARNEPLLALVSINRANREGLLRGRDGACVSLEEAFDQLGQATCTELAKRLSRARIALEHPILQRLAAGFIAEREALGQALKRLSAHQSIAAGPLDTAVNFCRLGEMAVICAIQHYLNYGQQADDETIKQMVNHYAAPFGNQIKAQQQLPFLLRELTGSLFQLPQSGLRKDRILMRIAALETGFTRADPTQLQQLLRLIGRDRVDVN
ncbi:response regulator [Halopseudomonas sp.]|uniref:response regulator n=1 Tax=Halopseudomonas sp. TaxID=2901191 RepID=UPI00311FCDFB